MMSEKRAQKFHYVLKSEYWFRLDEANLQPIRSLSQIWLVRVISMEFLRCFLRRHFAGKPPVVSRNFGCFLRLAASMSLNTINWTNVMVQLVHA